MGSELMRVSRGWGMFWNIFRNSFGIFCGIFDNFRYRFYLSYASYLQVCCFEQIDLSTFPWVHGQGGDRAKSLWESGGSMLRVLPVNLMNRYRTGHWGQLQNNEGEWPGGRLTG